MNAWQWVRRGAAVALLAPCLSGMADTGGVPVLMYHRISATEAPGATVVPPERFAQQMAYLASRQYQTLSMDELVAIMRGEMTMPPKPVVITFDDGWRDALSAVPILNEHRFKASFWIITQAGIGWPHMEWSDIRELARNPRFEVGAHSATHPWDPASNLQTWMEGKTPGRSADDVRAELTQSKRTLEAQVGRPVRYWSWPQGIYTPAMVDMARQSGYMALLTTDDGAGNKPGDDVLRIKRIGVNGACDLMTFITSLADFKTGKC